MRCLPVAAFLLGTWLLATSSANAVTRHFWRVYSPDHGQTFSYGTEQDRVWLQWHRHLALQLKYTNDPFVDRSNPRQYDQFRFDFPGITLGGDRHTFYYRTPSGRSIPVARKQADIFGIEEVRLLPNALVVVERPRGAISVRLDIVDPAAL